MPRLSPTWTAANVVFALVFVFSAVVQWNDPDPYVWVVVYGAAAAACVQAIRRRNRVWLPAAVGLVALAWAASFAPGVLGEVEFLEMFGAFEMESVAIEESREMYGLLIVAGWMAVLVVRSRVGGAGGALVP